LHADMRPTEGNGAQAFDDGGTYFRAGRNVQEWQSYLNALPPPGALFGAQAVPQGQQLDAKEQEAKISEANAKLAEAGKAVDDLVKKLQKGADIASLRAAGDGSELAMAKEFIRQQGIDKTPVANDQADKLLKLAEAADRAKEQVKTEQKNKTAADSAIEQSKEKLADANEELRNQAVKLAHGFGAASETVEHAREEVRKQIEHATAAYGAGSPQTRQVSTEGASRIAAAQDVDVYKAAENAQKKTDSLREATMSQEQADEDRVRKLKESYDRDLANFHGDEQQKAQLAKIFGDNVAAEWSALQAKTPFAKQMQEWGDLTKNLQGQVAGFMNGAVDNLTSMLVTGKANWQSFAQSILKDLASMAIKWSMSGLMGGVGGMFGGAGGGAGGMGKMNAAGAGGGSKAGMLGGLTSMFGIHHTGGMVGNPDATRAVNAFSSLQRGEVPIIAQAGEGVISRGQMQALGLTSPKRFSQFIDAMTSVSGEPPRFHTGGIIGMAKKIGGKAHASPLRIPNNRHESHAMHMPRMRFASTPGFKRYHTGGMVHGQSFNHHLMASFNQANSIARHFAKAPRFHTGGIIGADEVPIIARQGEGVFTPAQMKSMGASGHHIELHNNVTVNAKGGTDEQNNDLARQVSAHVERIARSTVTDELRAQMRPGNMLSASNTFGGTGGF